MNAEYIPIDNLAVYENFKELIRNCNSAQSTSVLSRSVVSAISKQEIYNKRIDTLLTEVAGFIKKVYKYIEDEPEMKKNLQTLGTGSQLMVRPISLKDYMNITSFSMNAVSRPL